jgi:hypothetical protein
LATGVSRTASVLGLPLHQQALVGDPGANPAGMVLSHAGASMILP